MVGTMRVLPTYARQSARKGTLCVTAGPSPGYFQFFQQFTNFHLTLLVVAP